MSRGMSLGDSLYKDIQMQIDGPRRSTVRLGYDVQIFDIPTVSDIDGKRHFERLPLLKLSEVGPSCDRVCTKPGILKNDRETTPLSDLDESMCDNLIGSDSDSDEDGDEYQVTGGGKNLVFTLPLRSSSNKGKATAARKHLPSTNDSDSSDSEDEIATSLSQNRKRRLHSTSLRTTDEPVASDSSDSVSGDDDEDAIVSMSSKRHKRSAAANNDASSSSSESSNTPLRTSGWTPINVPKTPTPRRLVAASELNRASSPEARPSPTGRRGVARPRTPLPDGPRTPAKDLRKAAGAAKLAEARLELHKKPTNCHRCLKAKKKQCAKHPQGPMWTQLPWPPNHPEAIKREEMIMAAIAAGTLVFRRTTVVHRRPEPIPRVQMSPKTPAPATSADDLDAPEVTQLPKRRFTVVHRNKKQDTAYVLSPTTLLHNRQRRAIRGMVRIMGVDI